MGKPVGRKSRRAHDEPFRIGVIAPDLSRLAHDLARGAVSSGNQLHRRGIRPPETAPRAKRLKSGADTGH